MKKIHDAEMVCADYGDRGHAAVCAADPEADAAGGKLILAGAVVRKLRRAQASAEESGAKYIKVPVRKYTTLLREAEMVIRGLYDKTKTLAARVNALEGAPAAPHRVDVKEFPRRLRAARKAVGLTQQQLASRAYVSHVMISRLESGTLHAKWARVVELAEVLGCSPEWLAASEEVFVCPKREN